ncbi:MAG TPA: hypothetical protein VGL81_22480 [Polyangiaceae bacterium]|nr:hypothetical protein [Polyangiaceae bacterium]
MVDLRLCALDDLVAGGVRAPQEDDLLVPQYVNRAEGTYYEDVRAIIAFLWAAARDGRAGAFTEVSRMQTLFRAGEPWSPKTLEDFALAAWQYVGFQS